MPTPTSISVNVRDALATALASVTASVYSEPPETVIPPACIIVPNEPYLESEFIGNQQVRVKINLVVTAAVAYYSNAGALDNLEKLIVAIMGVIPTNYTVGNVTRPNITQVGATNLLVSDLDISTYYTQQTI
jgi:hypothetical protein